MQFAFIELFLLSSRESISLLSMKQQEEECMELEEVLSRIEEQADKYGGAISDVHAYFDVRQRVYAQLAPHLSDAGIISEANWLARRSLGSSQELGIHVKAGDICYVDYGPGYLFECGYQHFGLIMKLVQYKALIIPMTSNPVQYAQAYDPDANPQGRRHLCPIGQPEGMLRPSVLFLNDLRFINTARIIEVRAHLGDLRLRKVKNRLREMLDISCS